MGKAAVRLAFGLALFAIVASFVDLTDAFDVLTTLDLGFVVIACGCLLASRFVVALKWWVLLGGRGSSVRYAIVQRAILLADYHALLFANTLAIDALKLVLLRHHERGLTYMASTIVADRIVNVMVAAATALAGMLVLANLPVGAAIPSEVTVSVVGLALVLLVVGFAVQSDRLFRYAVRVLDRMLARGALRRHVLGAIARIETLHRSTTVLLAEPATLLKAIVLSVTVLLLRIGVVYFLLVAADTVLEVILLLAVYPIIMLIVLLPITILGIGVQDSAFVFFLGRHRRAVGHRARRLHRLLCRHPGRQPRRRPARQPVRPGHAGRRAAAGRKLRRAARHSLWSCPGATPHPGALDRDAVCHGAALSLPRDDVIVGMDSDAMDEVLRLYLNIFFKDRGCASHAVGSTCGDGWASALVPRLLRYMASIGLVAHKPR